MKKKLLSYISNGLLIAGIAIGIYVFADIYLLNGNSAGSCPINDNKPLMYTAVGLCCASLVLSFLEPKKEKKLNKDNVM